MGSLAEPTSGYVDFKAVGSAALGALDVMVPRILLGGYRKGRERIVPNPTRNNATPGSFSINLQTGIWAEFATGATGSDGGGRGAGDHGADHGDGVGRGDADGGRRGGGVGGDLGRDRGDGAPPYTPNEFLKFVTDVTSMPGALDPTAIAALEGLPERLHVRDKASITTSAGEEAYHVG
jgi:hypothetical protein